MQFGTNKIEDFSDNNIISIYKNSSNPIKAEIYKLFQENNIRFYKMSKRLKSLLILSINQQNKSIKENKRFEKVNLINKKWLEEYGLYKVNSFIQKNEKLIQNELKNINEVNFVSIDKIISRLDKQSLIDLEKEILQNKIDNSYKENYQTIYLINKPIKFSQDFILFRENVFPNIKECFNINNSSNNIEYCFFNNKDIFSNTLY